MVAVLLIGLAAGFFLAGGGAGDDDAGVLSGVDAAEVVPEATEPEGADAAGGPSLEPLAAAGEEDEIRQTLARFLEAEATDDYESSFGLLSQADRDEYGVVAQWAQAHADLPPITGAEVTEVGQLGGRVVGRSDLQLDSTLNTFVGLVPSRAVGTWLMVQEEGDWRVSFNESTLRGSYPSDEDAVRAAQSWAAAYAEQCRRPSDAAYEGPLYGADYLLDGLCAADGEVEVDTSQRLAEDQQGAPFVAAFGSSVYGWARVVPLTEPTPLRLVLAPVEHRWSVIGVLQP